MNAEERAALRALADEATPGPWAWHGNVDSHSLRLTGVSAGFREDGTPRTDRTTVMDFVRWGMQRAKPRFNLRNLMHTADEFAVYEVNRKATKRTDPGVYRGDVVDLRHPDPRFIAAARSAVPALLDDLDEAERRLAAVLDYHRPYYWLDNPSGIGRTDHQGIHPARPELTRCTGGCHIWPCPTVRRAQPATTPKATDISEPTGDSHA